LLQQALEKVAFLPFGLLVDKWRWEVFVGQVKPQDYNKAWWELRKKYQGIVPPVERTEADFDPGAKYHVPGNVPYARYFLARILQISVSKGTLPRTRIQRSTAPVLDYGNKAAGEKLNKMLAMGQSKPWPEALETLTGEKQMDAAALADYFAPLKAWLTNRTRPTVTRWAGSGSRVELNKQNFVCVLPKPIKHRGNRGIQLHRRTAAPSPQRAEFAEGEIAPQRDGMGRSVAFSCGDHAQVGRDGAARRYFSGAVWRRGAGLHRIRAGIEELSRVDGSVGLIVAAHNSLCSNHIFKFARKGRREVPCAASFRGRRLARGR